MVSLGYGPRNPLYSVSREGPCGECSAVFYAEIYLFCGLYGRMLKVRRALDSDKNWREMATLQELMND